MRPTRPSRRTITLGSVGMHGISSGLRPIYVMILRCPSWRRTVASRRTPGSRTRSSMLARTLFTAVVAFAATAATATARDLTVVTRSDAMTAAARTLYVQPFASASTIATTLQDWQGSGDPLETRLKSPDNTWDVVQVHQRRTGGRLRRGLVREARLQRDRRQGSLPAAGRVRLRRRRDDRQPRAGVGPRQVPGHPDLGGFLGRREVSRQTRPAPRAAAAIWSSR